MRAFRFHLLVLALAVLAGTGAALAQGSTGSVSGSVTDEQGAVLQGVTVTLIGRAGSTSVATDANGVYRFPAVNPGVYTINYEMASFQSRREENVQVSIGRQLTLDVGLKVAGVAETISVVAQSAVVDVSSSSTDSNLSQDILFNLPISRTNAAVNILNNAPGINSQSAYGGGASSANALMLDGVDTRDPEGGSAWTFFNYNIIEEVEIKGLGAPAEYGSYTGAVVNSITKSGGNLFTGLFDVTYTNNNLSKSNVTQELIDQNGSFKDRPKTNKLLDFTTQVGGPIVRDKAFFFVSAQRYELKQDPSGPRTRRNEVSPRFNAKITLQPNTNNNFLFTFQADDYNVIGRSPGGLEFVAGDEITNREDAPEYVWLTQWRHLFGSNTFAEVKYTGYWGYFDLNPEVRAAGHLDGETGEYSVSQGWFAYFDRGRHQVNASLSHSAEAFGRHDLKFGAEIERSRVRNRYGYIDNIFYYDYGGAPYLAYDYGYDVSGRNHRESLYAQDSWKVSDRFTVNPGVRLDLIRGVHPDIGKVYDTKNLQPRIGFAWDVTADRNTVLKAHYGQYYEAPFTSFFTRATPGIGDFILYEFFGGQFVEIDRSPSLIYKIDPDIKHPRVDEFTVGVERAISADMRLTATGVWRENKNLIDSVFPDARWTPVTGTNALTNQPITLYRWANRAASQENGLVTNVDGFQYRDPAGNVLGTADAFRKYRGLLLSLNRRYRNRWQANVSYVLSKAEGTVDNTFGGNVGNSRQFETPTRALVNVNGLLTNDRRHELKVYATYQIPRIELGVNGILRSVSGRNYTLFQRFGTSLLDFPQASSAREPLLEPRGSRHFPAETLVDLRLDKQFRITERDRLSFYVDIENLFNKSTVTAVQLRAPSRTIVGIGAIAADAPTAIFNPRQVTLGGRWAF